MSAVFRLLIVTFDTSSDVLNGLNFLKVHLSFGRFIDQLLDSLGGSATEEDEENSRSDPIWGAMAIGIIFLPGIVYALISLPDILALKVAEDETEKTYSDSNCIALKEIPSSKRKRENDVENDFRISFEEESVTEDKQDVPVEESKKMKVLSFLFYFFVFPLAFLSNCLW